MRNAPRLLPTHHAGRPIAELSQSQFIEYLAQHAPKGVRMPQGAARALAESRGKNMMTTEDLVRLLKR